ncbi:MAG: peptidoglycan editing factor PgeF, partial [Fidelibacterota bacterium]
MIPFEDYSDLFHHPAFVAGFSCRARRSGKLTDREQLAVELGLDPGKLVYPNQVHSSTVAWVDRPGHYSATDGILTDNKAMTLSIQVADCIPVFLLDAEKAWGLVHAGWRGLVSGIIPNAIRQMNSRGSQSKHIAVVLGPSICAKHFEIGQDIESRFDPRFVLHRDNKTCVDLKGIARDQLMRAGVPAAQITTHDGCTWEEKDHYYSYRREGQAAGRMIAIMG